MNLLMRLPKHPHIVPFDRVVLNELEGRVIGFTCKFIPGGTLWENGSRIFKLKWLQQLTHVVDDLNLRFGISHQDVAPRNILIDDTTDSIKLFDFNFSAHIKPLLSSPPNEKENYREDRNDVKGVIFTLYEIITRDDSFRSMDHRKQNVNDLPSEWDKHPDVQLDSPVATYRQLLEDWRRTREAIVDGQPDAGPGRAPQAFDWPTRRQPPRKSLPVLDWEMKPSTMVIDQWFESRQEVRDRGSKVLNWERPPQETLAEGDCLLSTGERMKCQ
jgi:serine/threonine protein kinase